MPVGVALIFKIQNFKNPKDLDICIYCNPKDETTIKNLKNVDLKF